jgi:hypothetical protein
MYMYHSTTNNAPNPHFFCELQDFYRCTGYLSQDINRVEQKTRLNPPIKKPCTSVEDVLDRRRNSVWHAYLDQYLQGHMRDAPERPVYSFLDRFPLYDNARKGFQDKLIASMRRGEWDEIPQERNVQKLLSYLYKSVQEYDKEALQDNLKRLESIEWEFSSRITDGFIPGLTELHDMLEGNSLENSAGEQGMHLFQESVQSMHEAISVYAFCMERFGHYQCLAGMPKKENPSSCKEIFSPKELSLRLDRKVKELFRR